MPAHVNQKKKVMSPGMYLRSITSAEANANLIVKTIGDPYLTHIWSYLKLHAVTLLVDRSGCACGVENCNRVVVLHLVRLVPANYGSPII